MLEALHHLVKCDKRRHVVDLRVLTGGEETQIIERRVAGACRRREFLRVDAQLGHVLRGPSPLELYVMEVATRADVDIAADNCRIPLLEHADERRLDIGGAGVVSDVSGLEQKRIQGYAKHEAAAGGIGNGHALNFVGGGGRAHRRSRQLPGTDHRLRQHLAGPDVAGGHLGVVLLLEGDIENILLPQCHRCDIKEITAGCHSKGCKADGTAQGSLYVGCRSAICQGAGDESSARRIGALEYKESGAVLFDGELLHGVIALVARNRLRNIDAGGSQIRRHGSVSAILRQGLHTEADIKDPRPIVCGIVAAHLGHRHAGDGGQLGCQGVENRVLRRRGIEPVQRYRIGGKGATGALEDKAAVAAMNHEQALHGLHIIGPGGNDLHRETGRRRHPEYRKIFRIGLQETELAPGLAIRVSREFAGGDVDQAARRQSRACHLQSVDIGIRQGADEIDQIVLRPPGDQNVTDADHGFERILDFDRRRQHGNVARRRATSADFQLVGSGTGMDRQRLLFAGVVAAGNRYPAFQGFRDLHGRSAPRQPAIDSGGNLLPDQTRQLIDVGKCGGLALGHGDGQRCHPLVTGALHLQIKHHVAAKHGGDGLACGHSRTYRGRQLVVDDVIDGGAEIQRLAELEIGKRQQGVKVAGVAQQGEIGAEILQHLDHLRRRQAGQGLQVREIR